MTLITEYILFDCMEYFPSYCLPPVTATTYLNFMSPPLFFCMFTQLVSTAPDPLQRDEAPVEDPLGPARSG